MVNAPKHHAIILLMEQPSVLNIFTNPLNLDRNKKKYVLFTQITLRYKQFGHCLEIFTLQFQQRKIYFGN